MPLKTVTIPDPTQADLDAQIALGNYPSGTVLADIALPSDYNAIQPEIDTKQDILVSGTNIKTLNGSTILGSGNLAVGAAFGSITGDVYEQDNLQAALNRKKNGLIRAAGVGSSLIGAVNSQYNLLLLRYGRYFAPTYNGGNSGQFSRDAADHLNMNVINQDADIAFIAIARNDMGAGTILSTPAAGIGSVANALYYLPRIDSRLKKAGVFRVYLSEIPFQGGAGTVATNILAWNAYLATWVANKIAAGDTEIMFIDAAAEIANPTTGVPLIPTITATATGTSGTNTVVLSGASGVVTTGMSIAGTGVAGKTLIEGVSGTTLTLNKNLTGALSSTAVQIFTDYEDTTHASTIGAGKMCDKIFTEIVARKVIDAENYLFPLTSTTPAAGIDNFISNALCENSSGGLATGWSTTFTGTKSVVADADFVGFAQRVEIPAGEVLGAFLTAPTGTVRTLRKRNCKFGWHLKLDGFDVAGYSSLSIGIQFDFGSNNPPALPTQFTDVSNPMLNQYQNIGFDGNVYLQGECEVPENATNANFLIQLNRDFPVSAATAVILAGEPYFFDAENPAEEKWLKYPSRTVTSSTAMDIYDDLLTVNTASATNQTLPSASSAKSRRFTIRNRGAGTVTVVGTINSATNYTLTTGNTVTVQSNGTDYEIVGDSGASGSGITRSVLTVSTNTAAGSTALTDYVYLCSGTMDLTMPSASGNTNKYDIKNTDTGVITIIGAVDGGANPTLTTQYESITLVSNGTDWSII